MMGWQTAGVDSAPLHVIMTHDVDWPIHGPPREHIMARVDRFDEQTRRRLVKEPDYNPYYGVPEIMALEEKYGMQSTFFFRPMYDDRSRVEKYEETIKGLVKHGWEVGVHLNNAGLQSQIADEKRELERVTGCEVKGSRVHYLKIRRDDLVFLERAGLSYDSSVVFSKDSIDKRNTGFFRVGNLVVFPITIMDAYLFTYMHATEDRVLEFIRRGVEIAAGSGFMTILWHDNSLKMSGGRMFGRILEYLASLDHVRVIRGIDAYGLVMESSQKHGSA